MTTDIETIIREIIGEHFDVSPKDHELLELDSIIFIEILEEIETRCNIRVHPSELIPEHFSTIAQMILFFRTK